MGASNANIWDGHVQNNVNGNFLSSARCVIYAKPSSQSGGTTISNGADMKTLTKIGLIQGWNWGEQKQIEMIFELGSDVYYLIPGRTTGQISLGRVVLFGQDLVNMIYNDSTQANDQATFIRTIGEIVDPLDLLFCIYPLSAKQNQVDSAGVQRFSRLFSGCHIQARSESVGSGQILIAENVSIMYERILDFTPGN
jgi:hypothetical protein